jgi:hypothetical protein
MVVRAEYCEMPIYHQGDVGFENELALLELKPRYSRLEANSAYEYMSFTTLHPLFTIIGHFTLFATMICQTRVASH